MSSKIRHRGVQFVASFIGVDEEWVVWTRRLYSNISDRGDSSVGGWDRPVERNMLGKSVTVHFQVISCRVIASEGDDVQGSTGRSKGGAGKPHSEVSEASSSTMPISLSEFYDSGNNLPPICCIKSRSYSHNHLKGFIALQNFTPVVQRLHPFTTPAGRTRNGQITIGHAGFLWRIGPTANMSRQSPGDGNFKERGRRAHHDNAGYDLRRMISRKRVKQIRETTHRFLH